MPGYIDRSRQTLPDELRDIQLENPEPGPAANPRPAATEVERDATAAEMRHSQMSNQFRVFTPIDIHASNSPLMADLEGRASPADFAQHLPQSHDMTASRILEAARTPGQLTRIDGEALAVDAAMAQMLSTNPDYVHEFIVDGKLVGEVQYEQANRTLRQMDAQADKILDLYSRGENGFQTQRQYDRWLRSLNSAKSDYIKLAETYADLTGHQVDYGDPSEIQNREQASAFVDSQHQQAQEALGNAFTIAQRDYMEVRAGVADFDWVEDPNLQGLLEVKPELYTQFQSERSARDQAHAVEEFFTSSRYQEFGIDRTSINPHNGVVGVVAAGSPPVELSVEEQISRALDPAVRRIDQDRRMADPVGQPHRSQYLESMQDVVEVFGTQSEKQQLSQMIRQENAAYFDRIDEIRDAAQAQRDTQREQERQARREELHRQNVDDYVRYSRSGSGRNNPALSSLRQSRQVVSDASRELARFNPEQRIREEVAAGIQQNRAREEADRAAHNIDFARSLEGRFRAHGSPIDLSERIDELQGRAALAETRAEAFGAIAQDTTSPAAREAREFLEGTEQTWQQTLDNMAQLDPQEETPIPTQELPEEVQQRVEENLERESSALFNSLHKLFENMSTATNQERAFSERLEIITAETFDTSSLALPESITVEQLVANLEEQRAEAEQTIVGLEASINELLRGADQNLLQRAAAIASRKMSDDDDLFTPLVSRTIEETLDNRRDEP